MEYSFFPDSKYNFSKFKEKTNESLQMAINELASLTKIEEVAKDQGLSYNNSKIRTVKTPTKTSVSNDRK